MTQDTPEKLREWLEWAERLKTADLYSEDDYRDLTLRLSDNEIAEMGEFYKRALRDNSIQMLRKWVRSHRGEVPMSREEMGIRNLLHFWRRLNTQSCVPFNKSPVLDLGEGFTPTPDWSKVPADMRVLGEAALACDKFEYVFSPEGREHILNTVTAEERKILASAAERVRKIGFERIKTWSYPLLKYHVEARLLSKLIAVLDALELPYYVK
jgi:hypothetical protein